MLATGFAVASAVASTGCRGDTGSDDESGLSETSTGIVYEPCDECELEDKEGYSCFCDAWLDDTGDHAAGSICAENDDDAEAQCEEKCIFGGPLPPQPNTCEGNTPRGSCIGWAPGSEITLTGGIRYVDGTWLTALIASPHAIWTCDDAYLDPVSGGGFRVGGANSGEFLYALGLRDNDIPQDLNGMPLDDYEDAADAFAELYLTEGENTYDLAVLRGTLVIHFDYVVTGW